MSEYGRNFRAPQVDVHRFAMVPRAEIPRSMFRVQNQHKTTINGSYLYPVYVQDVLPGDSFNVSMTAFVRLATPIFPIMDNLKLESFFFFVPNRLVWVHWANFMGEQNNPSDSISYSIPQINSPVGGFLPFTLGDYFGLPVNWAGGLNTVGVSALPWRAYNLIWQEWFRDENLAGGAATGTTGTIAAGAKWMCQSDDGPDIVGNYPLLPAAKIHDYFTTCLPWTQKGGTAITLPLGTSATVKTNLTDLVTGSGNPMFLHRTDTGGSGPINVALSLANSSPSGLVATGTATSGPTAYSFYPSNLYADLSTASAATINAIRLAFQTQRLLERDARAGTRYTEIVRSHFGVVSPDARMMRPEYLGGGKSPLSVTPVPQTTATGATGTTSPLGTLAAAGTGILDGSMHGFRYSATEHGYIIGLVCARREQIYQQGIRRHWSRLTRYDFYFPVFSMLGEQAVLNKEIYADGSANDALVFGYQERWGEYRYHPSFTSGYFRSTTPSGVLDAWHLATKFGSVPTLNQTFIQDDTSTVLQRVLAAGASANNQELLCDFFFDEKIARPMPVYSVPGMIDHF